MKLSKFYLVLATAGALSFVACSGDDEPGVDVVEPVVNYNVKLDMTDNGFDLGGGARFTPGFAEGAKAGLFAVKGGVISASNVELTYDGTSWGTDDVIAGGDHYYVYTPYKSDAASKVNASATDAAGFFAGLIQAYAIPGTEQGDFDTSIRPCDVVYAAATVTRGRSETVVENLTLSAAGTHALAITSWELPGGTRYTTSDGFTYNTPDGAKAGDVKLGSATLKPFAINGRPAYFHIPGKSDKLSVNYTLNNEAKSADVSLSAEAGKMKVEIIGGGRTDGGRRDLAVGDLYYRDGSVLPSGTDIVPEGVAGVVFCVDPKRFSDEEKSLLGNVHALVISAKMGTAGKKSYVTWNDAYPKKADYDGRYKDNVEDPAKPGLVLPVIEDRTDFMKSYTLNNADISGYKYNQIIRKRRSQEIADGDYAVFTAIDDLKSTVPVPSSTTGWYLPSIGHLLDLARNIGGANANESTVMKYFAGETCDFNFDPQSSPSFIANLDASMSKIPTAERDLYSGADNALWTSSYGSVYHTYVEAYMPGVRQFVFDGNILYVMSYDVIGRGNVRGILAF